jgi:hypothetical protein
VAAGEQQPQPVIRLGRHRPLQQRQLVAVSRLALELVEAAPPGDGEQPGVRPVRDALGRPVHHGRLHRVLDQVLGGREVTGQVHQRRGEPACVVAHHTGQLAV